MPRGSIGRGLRLAAGWTIAVLAVLGLEGGDAIAQCALCRDALLASSTETREAMNHAIIGLAFAPFLVAGLAVWALFPSRRSGLRARLQSWLRGKAEVKL